MYTHTYGHSPFVSPMPVKRISSEYPSGHPLTTTTTTTITTAPVAPLPADPRWIDSVDRVMEVVEGHMKLLETPLSYAQLRTNPSAVALLSSLTLLFNQCEFKGVVFGLMNCLYSYREGAEEESIDQSRSWACEIIAIRVVRALSPINVVRVLALDWHVKSTQGGVIGMDDSDDDEEEAMIDEDDEKYQLLSALEVAIMAEAKFFLNSPAVQRALTDIWKGNIEFFSSIDDEGYHARKEITVFIPNQFWAGYARLRVPRYRFAIQEINFAIVLCLLFAVLTQQSSTVTVAEVLMDVWLAGMTYDEYGQMQSAGSYGLYAANPWSFFDMGMIVVFLAWLAVRALSWVEPMHIPSYLPFNVLALEALFLVPRFFSTLSLFRAYGSLIPTLKEMIMDFLKFIVIVVALFAGFFVTFLSLGRSSYTADAMFWLLVRIFFGSSYLGFDEMSNISPVFGPPLMVVFCILSNFLLVTILISILSNSFAKNNSKEQYGFIFAVSCVESIISDHLAVFIPPLNLLQLIFIRPLRLILPSKHRTINRAKFRLLKITHAPFVVLVSIYERFAHLTVPPGYTVVINQAMTAAAHEDDDDDDEPVSPTHPLQKSKLPGEQSGDEQSIASNTPVEIEKLRAEVRELSELVKETLEQLKLAKS